MDKADLVIRGGTVVSHETSYRASVAIRGGIVVAVGTDESMPASIDTLDATGLHVLPGVVDVHVHFREPGNTHKEDWETGTAAAACGGVTTVFDMPNVIPPTATPEALQQKHGIASEKAFVDFGLYGLLGENNVADIDDLVAGGVIGFKCFTGNTYGHSRLGASTGAMLEGFEVIARHGHRISLHAETASIMGRREERMKKAGRADVLSHLAARPAVVAIEAVSRAAILAEWTGARIHILHISSADELQPLRQAKARGVDITGETCAHYLLLNTSDYNRIGSVIRVNPPIREAHHQQELWSALGDGTLDLIASDHCPHTREEKVNEDIWSVESGLSGIELQMPLMLTEVNNGRLSISDYVRLSSTSPAKVWGLYPKKGLIQVGADADLAIVDLRKTMTINDEALHSRAKITPWNGRSVKGLPIHTIVRGRFVMKDRVLVESAKGWGKSVHTTQRLAEPGPRHTDHSMTEIVKLQPEDPRTSSSGIATARSHGA